MINAIQEYDELIETELLTPELVIHLYIAARLKPLSLNKICTRNNLDILAEFIADSFFEQNYSIDILINATIEYINATNTFPTQFILNNDPLALIQEYGDA